MNLFKMAKLFQKVSSRYRFQVWIVREIDRTQVEKVLEAVVQLQALEVVARQVEMSDLFEWEIVVEQSADASQPLV